ncbi:GPP34 family phosphoprotein [Brevibacterium sp. HMSC063G07]|uniref:GOLPH3/VPS74 family protein n=1 Tax=Brevibacterium sp. HMSC063G07 TaxID=1739261 RepID=UPI0008A4E953|nr:GPP34 family phosphoprotein [Brevibacterium sp. HMSC063G07]OFL66384.1 hypothetical protein HMPREF2757_03200 [Brevibacterium sp. HMSC063G07]
MSLIADDLIVLLSKPEGPVATGKDIDAMLAGAVFCDLVLVGAVAVPDLQQRRPRVGITEGTTPADPFLATALARLRDEQEKSKKPLTTQKAIEALTENLHRSLMERLKELGVVRSKQKKFLFIPAGTAWRLAEGVTGDELRKSIARQLDTGPISTAPKVDERTGALLGFLAAGKKVEHAIDGSAPNRKELIEQAQEAAEASAADSAVRKAIKKAADEAAIMAASAVIAASTTVVTSS